MGFISKYSVVMVTGWDQEIVYFGGCAREIELGPSDLKFKETPVTKR
jgi:hypothetical protein